jgi:hypothetical protein
MRKARLTRLGLDGLYLGREPVFVSQGSLSVLL